MDSTILYFSEALPALTGSDPKPFFRFFFDQISKMICGNMVRRFFFGVLLSETKCSGQILYSRLYFSGKKDIPVSVENIVNNAIDTESLPNPNFVWNILLVYSFD
ncbi:hypothetical protein [Christiangramia flava]|uniref:Uncharacterized protein n=1 Tax=Christiangramia flava JLT2011 TaxID=1229726 RepID=A0A1L7I3M6_9FLAO|nr:hypothetical protein [Christiangramia flava]APU67773.1 hypothetical protein GRFL_1049 [Christiangramia flava JLT2011]